MQWSFNFHDHPSLSEAQIQNAITDAMDAWSNICGIKFRRVYLHERDVHIQFLDSVPFVSTYGQFAGYSTVVRSSVDTPTGEIIINRGPTGAAQTQGDLQGLMTHELGHALGLSHSNVKSSIMFSNPYHSYAYQRTPRAVDVAAINDIYPKGDPEVEPKPKEKVLSQAEEWQLSHPGQTLTRWKMFLWVWRKKIWIPDFF